MNPMLARPLVAALLLTAASGSARSDAAAARASPPETSPAAIAAPQPYDAGTVRFLAGSGDTQGRFAVVELHENAGYTTPPHRHDHMDEAFYVLEGTLRVTMHGASVDHPAGSFVLVPRGTVHAQGSATDDPVRVLVVMTPGGFESFFAGRVALARQTRRGEPAFEAGMMTLLREHARWIQPAQSAADH